MFMWRGGLNHSKKDSRKVRRSRAVLDTKVDVLLDAESEAPSVAEVPPEQLVLLDLEAALKQLHGLLAPHRDVAGDLLVTPDAERPHRVPRCKTNQPTNQRSSRQKGASSAKGKKRSWETSVVSTHPWRRRGSGR